VLCGVWLITVQSPVTEQVQQSILQRKHFKLFSMSRVAARAQACAMARAALLLVLVLGMCSCVRGRSLAAAPAPKELHIVHINGGRRPRQP
jgi:hypothetical protein